MTTKQIEAKMTMALAQAAVKHEVAIAIRKALDEARKAYGAEAWELGDLESEVLELVTGDPS